MSTLLNTIADKVANLLEHNLPTRDDDKYLVQAYLAQYHGIYTFAEYTKSDAPTFESLSRCRRKLQESGLFLPSLEVMVARAEMEKEFKEFSRQTEAPTVVTTLPEPQLSTEEFFSSILGV